jgi:hypothetical protein
MTAPASPVYVPAVSAMYRIGDNAVPLVDGATVAV